VLPFLADEDLNRVIVDGVLARKPDLDIVRAQDMGLARMIDPVVLTWAAERGRVLLTHDVRTMTRFAYERIRAGLPCPGVFVIPQTAPVGRIIDDLLVVAEGSLPNEWEGQVRYLPL
jgi:hypothetical protein